MQIFKSLDGLFSIALTDDLMEIMLNYCKQAKDLETGGILIGYYSTSLECAYITKVLGPPNDSKMGKSWFSRGIAGLQKIINDHWQKQKQYYVGEWHFHPYASANPSDQDIKQMRDVAFSNLYNCPEPIMFILGGDPLKKFTLKAFVFPEGKTIEMYT